MIQILKMVKQASFLCLYSTLLASMCLAAQGRHIEGKALGERPLIVIMTEFTDAPRRAEKSEFDNTVSKIQSYFKRISANGFTFKKEVVTGWLAMPDDRATSSVNESKEKDFFEKFCSSRNEITNKCAKYVLQVASSSIDFSKYDRDNDKKVTNEEIAIIWTRSYKGEYEKSAFNFVLTSQSLDGIFLENVHVVFIRELPPRLTVVLHELGHSLGLHDLYNYTGEDNKNRGDPKYFAPGVYDLMEWHGGLEKHGGGIEYLGAYASVDLGWLKPTDLTVSGWAYAANRYDGHSAVSGSTDPPNAPVKRIYKIVNPQRPTKEYLLIEYRRSGGDGYGNDEGLPDSGLAIWHIDEDGGFNIPLFGKSDERSKIKLERYAWESLGGLGDKPLLGDNRQHDGNLVSGGLWEGNDFGETDFSVTWTNGSPGPKLRCIHKVSDAIKFYFDKSGTGSVDSLCKPEFVPDGPSIASLPPVVGQRVQIKLKIRNVGRRVAFCSFGSSPFSCSNAEKLNIDFFVNGTGIGTAKTDKDIPRGTLLGEGRLVTIDWVPSRAGEHRITVKIDANNIVPELDENNNTGELRITVCPTNNPNCIPPGPDGFELQDPKLTPRGHGLGFLIQGSGVKAVQLEVFSLSGHTVYKSDWIAGQQLSWNMLDDRRRHVANGVYFYVITVKDAKGETIRSQVRKLAIVQ